MFGKKSSRWLITPSTGGLLAQMSSRANESRREDLESSGECDELLPTLEDSGISPSPDLRKLRDSLWLVSAVCVEKPVDVSPEVLGDLKVTERPLIALFPVFTVRAGLADRVWASPAFAGALFPRDPFLLFAKGIAKSPSSESSSDSSCGKGD